MKKQINKKQTKSKKLTTEQIEQQLSDLRTKQYLLEYDLKELEYLIDVVIDGTTDNRDNMLENLRLIKRMDLTYTFIVVISWIVIILLHLLH